jgi:hypothetical protein
LLIRPAVVDEQFTAVFCKRRKVRIQFVDVLVNGVRPGGQFGSAGRFGSIPIARPITSV